MKCTPETGCATVVQLDEPLQFTEHRRASGVCRGRGNGVHIDRAAIRKPGLWCEGGHPSMIEVR